MNATNASAVAQNSLKKANRWMAGLFYTQKLPSATRPWNLRGKALVFAGLILLGLTVARGLQLQHATTLAEERELLSSTLANLKIRFAEIQQQQAGQKTTEIRSQNFSEEFARNCWASALRSISRSKEIATSLADHSAPDLVVQTALPTHLENVAIVGLRIDRQNNQSALYQCTIKGVTVGPRPRSMADAFAKALQKEIGARFQLSQPVGLHHLRDFEATPGSPAGLTRAGFDLDFTLNLNAPKPGEP